MLRFQTYFSSTSSLFPLPSYSFHLIIKKEPHNGDSVKTGTCPSGSGLRTYAIINMLLRHNEATMLGSKYIHIGNYLMQIVAIYFL